MHLVMTKEDPCWVKLSNGGGRFISALKNGVKPSSYRKWDSCSQTWLVHYKWLHWTVTLARRFYEHVDYSQLPTRWQLIAAGAQVASDGFESKGVPDMHRTPHSVLYVTTDAPMEVVHAAYKALAFIHHPDRTKDDGEAFKEIVAAYETLCSERL